MSVNHVYHASGKVNFQIKPAFKTVKGLRAGVNHNKRIGREGKGANIDEGRSYLNTELLGATADEIYLNEVNRITGKEYTEKDVPSKDNLRYVDGRKVRSDAVLAFEIEASYPGDLIWCKFDRIDGIIPVPDDVAITAENIGDFFEMPLNANDFFEWVNASMNFIVGRYGDDNIVSAHVHMDEGEPHIHVIGVPVKEDDRGILRLKCKDVIGNARDLARLQTDYANALAPLGYVRGDYYSSRKSDINIKEYKARVNAVLSEVIPDSLEECREEVKNLRAKNFQLEQEMGSMHSNDHIQNGLRKKVRELEKENYDLKRHNEQVLAQAEAYRNQLQVYIDKAACEERGRVILIENPPYDNMDKILKVYDMLTGKFLETGYNDLLEQGYELHFENSDGTDQTGTDAVYDEESLEDEGYDEDYDDDIGDR